jgi:formylglycine-generating enzyme required for sulfatase activity
MNPLAIDFIKIPEAEFLMGSNEKSFQSCLNFWSSRLVDPTFTKENFAEWIRKELPNFKVKLSSFEVSKFPITNRQYLNYLSENNASIPSSIESEEPLDHPVWGVSDEEAIGFTKWLSERCGFSFRLPTEAEWEFVARGLEGREYPYGNEFSAQKANTLETGLGKTTPVDAYEKYPSEFGVCDLAGNVEEWVLDYYSPYPGGKFIEDDLVQTLGPRYRLLRGGSFNRGGDLTRSARRHGKYPSKEYQYTGFRIVKEIN